MIDLLKDYQVIERSATYISGRITSVHSLINPYQVSSNYKKRA